jgi:NAD(P)-dependent dehydrogenase (short-subunit alcohol dehydrogenase family)
VKAFAGRRDKVFACVRASSDREALDAFAASTPHWVQVIEMDVSDPAQIGRARRKLEAEPIDVLVNNAGIGGPDRQSATDMDFLPNVKAAKGRIITLSSQMGATGASADNLAYRVSKQAVNRLMRGLATELKPHGIPVLIVNPGWVKTDMGGEGAQLSPEDSAANLLKLIDRLDIASTGRFLAWNGKELAW